MERRQLGRTSVYVSPVALGCWPIAGMTSLDVNESDSIKTIQAALDCGVNFFDTAYCYGSDGESERLLGRVIASCRQEVVVASKGGIHWQGSERQLDASPDRIQYECSASLKRLGTNYLDLYYLHAPDPSTPIEESAIAFSQLVEQGCVRAVGVSNLSVEQTKRFHAICPLSAVQPPYNMLLRGIEAELIPWCQQNQISVIPYWPLMKGLLAGRLTRSHPFRAGDGRQKYSAFQGTEWQKNHDLLDQLRTIADSAGKTVAQLVVNWTIHQVGITAALCGAKRGYQIEETAEAMNWVLTPGQRAKIQAALQSRGLALAISAI